MAAYIFFFSSSIGLESRPCRLYMTFSLSLATFVEQTLFSHDILFSITFTYVTGGIMMNRRQLYWGNIITTRNVLAGVSVSEAGPQPGTGNYPPEIFANMMVFVLYMKRFFSKLCYLYVNVFPRQPFCIRYVLRHIG